MTGRCCRLPTAVRSLGGRWQRSRFGQLGFTFRFCFALLLWLIPSMATGANGITCKRNQNLHLTHASVSRSAGLRRSFRLGKKSSWVRQAAPSKRWSAGLNGSNPPPTYREVIPYRRDPKDGHRLVVLVGGYELKKQCGWKPVCKETAEQTFAGCFIHNQQVGSQRHQTADHRTAQSGWHEASLVFYHLARTANSWV